MMEKKQLLPCLQHFGHFGMISAIQDILFDKKGLGDMLKQVNAI